MAKRSRGGKNNLKPPSTKISSTFTVEQPNKKSTNHLHPLFSFNKIISSYCIMDCENNEKISLIDKLRFIGSLTWQELARLSKNNGFEVIDFDSLNVRKPNFLTPDIDQVHVFRFNAASARLIGIRKDEVFEILYIDTKLRVYDH